MTKALDPAQRRLLMKPRELDFYFEDDRENIPRLEFDILVNNIFPPHFHSHIEIIYVTEGCLGMTVNGVQYYPKAGDCVIAEPYDIHSYHSMEPSRAYYVICPLTYVEDYIRLANGSSLSSKMLPCGPVSPELRHCFEKIRDSLMGHNLLAAQGYAYVLLATLAHTLGFVKGSQAKPSGLLQNVLRYTRTHYNEKITLEKLSQEFGYNPCYISQIFNKYMHCNIQSYVNTLRCYYAAQLLSDNEMTVSTISGVCGFESIRTFNRAFSATFRQTPSQYKNALLARQGAEPAGAHS